MRSFRLIDWVSQRFAPKGESRNLLAPPIVQALLEDIEGGEPNLLPLAASTSPLRVEIPMWQNSDPSPENPEVLDFFWDDMPLDSKTWEAPVSPEELFIMVPVAKLSEGTHSMCYIVTTSNQVTVGSMPLTITIDKTAPLLINEGPLLFPPEVMQDGVTDDWLKSHGEKLTARVPDYRTPGPGDVIACTWSRSATGTDPAGSRTLTEADLGAPIDIEFAGALIRSHGDGLRYARYTITDRAGNVSARALAVELEISAQPVPRELPAPTLKDATGSGANWTLQPVKAINGATVIVLDSATIKPGEKTIVQWGEPGSPGAYSTDQPTADGLRQYRIPKEYVSPHLNKSNIPVHYQVLDSDQQLHASIVSSLRMSALTNLPFLQCDCFNGGILSLAKVASNGNRANFTLGAWPFIGANQFIKVTVKGINPAGQPHEVKVLEAGPVVVGSSVPAGSISLQLLQGFKINASMDVLTGVSFDGKVTWIDFPRITATLTA